MDRILQKRVPEKLRQNAELDPLITELKQEVVGDYDFSVRKSIGKRKNQFQHLVYFQEGCCIYQTVYNACPCIIHMPILDCIKKKQNKTEKQFKQETEEVVMQN